MSDETIDQIPLRFSEEVFNAGGSFHGLEIKFSVEKFVESLFDIFLVKSVTIKIFGNVEDFIRSILNLIPECVFHVV